MNMIDDYDKPRHSQLVIESEVIKNHTSWISLVSDPCVPVHSEQPWQPVPRQPYLPLRCEARLHLA